MSIYLVTFLRIDGCFLGLFSYSHVNGTAGFEDGVGEDDRQEPLDFALRTLRGDAHDRTRRHRGERGVAGDPGRPRVYPIRPCVGRERVPDLLRGSVVARRASRGSDL